MSAQLAWRLDLQEVQRRTDALKPLRVYVVDDPDTHDHCLVLAHTSGEALTLGGERMPDSRRRVRLRSVPL